MKLRGFMAAVLLLCIPVRVDSTQETRRPKIGLALQGGGAKGLAHIGVLEWLEQHRLAGVPVHNIFTMLFVPATFLVAMVGGSVILLVTGNRANWFRSAVITGLAASLSFLIMDLLLDSLGMRVGAPRAAERFTMLTVAFLGSTAAAFSGGAILGLLLSKGAYQTLQQSKQGEASQKLL